MNGGGVFGVVPWNWFQARLLQILEHALMSMEPGEADVDEKELNRQLARCLRHASWELSQADGIEFPFTPSIDGLSAPIAADGEDMDFERKRPDFIWSLQDNTQPTADEACREFVVECKRLGEGAGGTSFNSEYVVSGMVRFVNETHRYGVHGSEGAMVGYVQRSTHVVIHEAVSHSCGTRGLPPFDAAAPLDAPLVEMSHALERAFGPTPFTLRHFWRDLRPPAA